MLNSKISQNLIHPQAIEVCRILHEAGHQAYIVGGCVRDLLLNQSPKDWDITTDASPQKVMSLFPDNYPTGLKHGTVTVVMSTGLRDGFLVEEEHFEVTTFRIEGEYKDGRRPEEVFFVMDVEQDLARRDLTINAIAYDPIAEKMTDPFGGLQDLQQNIIRAVGNANARFQEDGLRIMRVARFAARFGYSVDGATFKGMQDNLETLKKVSRERISDELCKTLMAANPSYGLMLLMQTGALDIACPLLSGRQLPLLPYQDKVNGELETRLAFLYNKIDPNLVGEEMVGLKLSNKEVKKIVFLAQLVERFVSFQQKDTASAYKSFMAVVKNHAPESWEQVLEQFITLSGALGYPSEQMLNKYRDEIVFSKKEMILNGNDLLEAGIKPGPQIKNILENCYLEILRNPEHNTKSFLLDFVKR